MSGDKETHWMGVWVEGGKREGGGEGVGMRVWGVGGGRHRQNRFDIHTKKWKRGGGAKKKIERERGEVGRERERERGGGEGRKEGVVSV